ncbi:MAG: hypothetical protein KDC07_03005 [Chitinophagaceae bacterium]|nr:hypothetical protein [Chitinophagaceae bacterium]MCB9044832.1 hypothetical protein [Chitinophagales bacterium]
MSSLSIKRENQFASRFRDITIEIDGGKNGTIHAGETKNILVQAGKHSIKAKVDFFTSSEYHFTVAENAQAKLRLRSPYLMEGYKWLLVVFRLIAASITILIGAYYKNYLLIEYFSWFIVAWVILEYLFDKKNSIFYYLLKRNEFLEFVDDNNN